MCIISRKWFNIFILATNASYLPPRDFKAFYGYYLQLTRCTVCSAAISRALPLVLISRFKVCLKQVWSLSVSPEKFLYGYILCCNFTVFLAIFFSIDIWKNKVPRASLAPFKTAHTWHGYENMLHTIVHYAVITAFLAW